MPVMFNETDMAAMAALRRAIDPQELANRGKMFPAADGGAAKYKPHPLEAMGVISRV